jgi:ribosomal protein L24E
MSRIALLIAALLLASCGLFRTDDRASTTPLPSPMVETAPKAQVRIPYALARCIVSGKMLLEDAVTFVVDGRTFRTCCPKCQQTIEEDPELWGHQVDAATIADQLRDYPLGTCLVSGKPLPESAVSALCGSTLVRLCCTGCKARFEAEPTHYLARLDTAKCVSYGTATINTTNWTPKQTTQWIQDQLPDYPLTNCPISGKPIDESGAPYDILLDGTLVRLCSEKCATKAEARAAEIATAVQSAAFAQQKAEYPSSQCAVSGKPLGDRASSTMLGTTLVRTCTSSCMSHLVDNRSALVATLRAARIEARVATKQNCCNTGGTCCCASEDSAPASDGSTGK